MEKEQLAQILSELFLSSEIITSQDPIRIKADPEMIHTLAKTLRDDSRLKFDYLINMYGIDWDDRFSVVYHLESTGLKHMVSMETSVADHDKPTLDTVSDLWLTAQFQEREIYDLMGISFNNHPDLRRLFLEDGWGFPLRKDYKDDINFIER